MQLLLTDRLTCPRCGPTFGLILLADRLIDRRVHEGLLGCPNCRDSFEISSGFADLRAPPRGEIAPGLAGPDFGPVDDDEAEGRLVALLGVERGPGTIALVGRPARAARGVAAAVENVQIVAVDADTRSWQESDGVSRLVAAPGLPFFSSILRGVVVDAELGRGILFEAARVVARRCRVVVVNASGDAATILEGGLSILAEEAGTVVAARS